MNPSEPPHLPAGTRRALRCLSLFLIPALGPSVVQSLPRSRPSAVPLVGPRQPDSPPYLPIVGAPALRFQRPTPPPDLVTHPVAAAPPIPKLTPTEVAVAQSNAEAAATMADPGEPPPPATENKPAAPSPEPKRVVRPIIPDDMRAPVRAEDFLPYFQIPGAARRPGEVNVIMPATITNAPATPLPPSSATYTQSPR